MSNFTFDGKQKPYCDYMSYNAGVGPDREVTVENIKGRTGGIATNVQTKQRVIEVEFLLDGNKSVLSMTEIVEDFIKWITSNEPKPMIFEREPDRVYYAMLQDKPVEEYFVKFSKVKANFVCLDPYKYSNKTFKNTAIQDQVTIVNSGTADTYPVIEARALKNSTSFMVTKADEDYFMIGNDDVNKQVVYDEHYIDDSFITLNATKWKYPNPGSQIGDNITGGVVGTPFTLYSPGILCVDQTKWYPSKSQWTGASYYQSYAKALKDYNVRTVGNILYNKNDFKGTGKFTTFIYDNSGRLVAAFGVSKSNYYLYQSTVFCYLYDEQGNSRKIAEYTTNEYANMHTNTTLIKNGDRFWFQLWGYKDGEVTLKREYAFVDKGKFYNRPIVKSQIYIARHANANDTARHLRTLIYRHQVQDNNSIEKNQIKTIVQAGDLIQIDMLNNTVMINDTPALDKKVFGCNYFSIDPGVTELLVFPENTFDTTVSWKDRFS